MSSLLDTLDGLLLSGVSVVLGEASCLALATLWQPCGEVHLVRDGDLLRLNCYPLDRGTSNGLHEKVEFRAIFKRIILIEYYIGTL